MNVWTRASGMTHHFIRGEVNEAGQDQKVTVERHREQMTVNDQLLKHKSVTGKPTCSELQNKK